MRIAVVTLVLSLFLQVRIGNAATHWKIPCGFGYMSAGGAATIGLVAVDPFDAGWNDEYDSVILAGLAGVVGGGIAGAWIGGSADRALAEGRPLSGLHRNAVRAGTVLTGASLGMIAAGIYIDSSEANLSGGPSDEKVMAVGIGTGAVLGILMQWMNEESLRPRLEPGIAPGGAELSLRWPL